MHGGKLRGLVTGEASFIGSALLDALLGRKPQLKLREGLRRAADWYFRAKKPEEAAAILDPILAERMPSAVSLSKEVATPN
jgi:nucleoside-diphosphate-sugar epimerase